MKKLVLTIAFIFIAGSVFAIDVVKSGNTYVVTPSADQIKYWEKYGGAVSMKAVLESWSRKAQRVVDAANKASLNDQCAGLSAAEKAQIDALLAGSPCADAIDNTVRRETVGEGGSRQ
jgi:hypothetical protein